MAKPKLLPPIEVLREYFSYDLETGIVIRLKPSKYKPHTSGPCGTTEAKGHLVVKFQGKRIKLHRLAWKLVTGQEPPDEIDHKNRDRADNRWVNLRASTSEGNCANSKKKPGAYMSGVKKVGNRFYAQKLKGGYATQQEAHDAYVKWHRERYGEFSVYA